LIRLQPEANRYQNGRVKFNGRLFALSVVRPDVFNGRGGALIIAPGSLVVISISKPIRLIAPGVLVKRLNRIAAKECDVGFAPIVRFST
jgi:hypothetical protein